MPRQKTHLACKAIVYFNVKTKKYDANPNDLDHPACNFHGWFPDMTMDRKKVTCLKCKKAMTRA